MPEVVGVKRLLPDLGDARPPSRRKDNLPDTPLLYFDEGPRIDIIDPHILPD